MHSIYKNFKEHLLLILIILFVAGFLRFWQLGNIPISMSDDETRLAYNAFSIWNTGKDINGTYFPLFFLVNNYAFNPVPIYLTSPFVGLLGLEIFTSRFIFALGGVLSVILLYFITYKVFNNRSIAFLASLAMSVSVWHIQISRFAYEGGIALLFNLLGIFFFLSIKKKNLLFTLLSMIAFFIAFYSYSGIKLIFLPIVLVLVWYKYSDLNLKQLSIVAFFVLLTFFSFAFLSKTQNASSYGNFQFFFQDIKKAAESVELERRVSDSPEIFKKIYHNKLTYWSKIFIERYSYALSPQYLFNSQEGSGIFSMWFRGQMYYIDILFLILGFLFIFSKKRKELLLILLFLFIAPVPSGMGSDPITYTIRSSFMIPWLMILTGSGIYSVSYFIKNKKILLFIFILIFVSYLYLVGGYLNQYYFEWMRYGARYYSKADQDLSNFINEKKNNKNEIIIDGVNQMTVLQYAFYSKMDPSKIQKIYLSKDLKISNISFIDNCFHLNAKNSVKQIPLNSIYILSAGCPNIVRGKGYLMLPDSIIKSLNGIDEWLVFERGDK